MHSNKGSCYSYFGSQPDKAFRHLLWNKKVLRDNIFFTCNCWPYPHIHPGSGMDLSCTHWCQFHTNFLQILKDRWDGHGSASPATSWKTSAPMITKAPVNAILMELVAPVAYLIFQHWALTVSPLRVCKSNNTLVPQTDRCEGWWFGVWEVCAAMCVRVRKKRAGRGGILLKLG